MKGLHFAIASIVDANTGNGLAQAKGSSDYRAAAVRGRTIRAKSIAALFNSIKARVVKVIAGFRAVAKQRRDLNSLMNLNDHLLDDIGLTRGDLHAVRLDSTTLDELNAAYVAARRTESSNQFGIAAVDSINDELAANNEQHFDRRKCA